MRESDILPITIIEDFKNIANNKKLIIIPLVFSVILAFFIEINTDLINILLVSLSIFIGFLLNLIMSCFNLKISESEPIKFAGKTYYIKDCIEEYFINISFTILISVLLVILLLCFSLLHNFIINNVIIIKIFNVIILFLISLFFLLILRIIRVTHVLIKYHVKN